MSEILRCTACGGTVRYVVEHGAGACIFCGATTLEVEHPDTPPEEPRGYVPPRVCLDEAVDRFRAWASSSFWYPKALRHAEVELSPLWLPAYRVAAAVSVHWAGLRDSTTTRSGKRPTSGTADERDEVYVPASGALTERELAALEPFDARAAEPRPPSPELAAWPQETPRRSPRYGRARGRERMTARARARAKDRENLRSVAVSCIFSDETTELLAVPVYVGVFRYKDRARRLLVNAQTGEVVGDAPLDPVKVTLAVLAVLALIVAAAFLFGTE